MKLTLEQKIKVLKEALEKIEKLSDTKMSLAPDDIFDTINDTAYKALATIVE